MDYDVAALSLATPPASAPVQSYRPAVAVKNLGIHDADVTGTLSIYDRAAGTLITTMNLAANSISPGETRNAVADKLWQPVTGDIGRAFIFTATIIYPPDQNLTNNNLQPVTVIVTAAPPTPPPPVEAHADQHEDGGGDQLTVEGLSGKLAEAQTPTEHASNHEDGGADRLDVAGLVGELATPQTPKIHATSHQVGGTDPVTGIEPGPHAATHSPEGGDEIDVTGLPGLLADAQTPKTHASSHRLDGTDELTTFLTLGANYSGGPGADVEAGQQVDLIDDTPTLAGTPSSLMVIGEVFLSTPNPTNETFQLVLFLLVNGVAVGRAEQLVITSPLIPLFAIQLSCTAIVNVPTQTPHLELAVYNGAANETVQASRAKLTALSIV